MKRLIPLLLIGAIALVLAFACGSSEEEEQPKKGDSIEVGTLKATEEEKAVEVGTLKPTEEDDSLPDVASGTAIEQDTLMKEKEPLPQDR